MKISGFDAEFPVVECGVDYIMCYKFAFNH